MCSQDFRRLALAYDLLPRRVPATPRPGDADQKAPEHGGASRPEPASVAAELA